MVAGVDYGSPAPSCTVVADQQTGVLKGGADPRRPSYALGLVTGARRCLTHDPAGTDAETPTVDYGAWQLLLPRPSHGRGSGTELPEIARSDSISPFARRRRQRRAMARAHRSKARRHRHLGAPVVVENRPGAGAVIGIQTLARVRRLTATRSRSAAACSRSRATLYKQAAVRSEQGSRRSRWSRNIDVACWWRRRRCKCASASDPARDGEGASGRDARTPRPAARVRRSISPVLELLQVKTGIRVAPHSLQRHRARGGRHRRRTRVADVRGGRPLGSR